MDTTVADAVPARIDAGTEQLEVSVLSGVATVVLNNPLRRNALSRAMVRALPHVLDRLAGDPAVRVVVRGAGRGARAPRASTTPLALAPSKLTLRPRRAGGTSATIRTSGPRLRRATPPEDFTEGPAGVPGEACTVVHRPLSRRRAAGRWRALAGAAGRWRALADPPPMVGCALCPSRHLFARRAGSLPPSAARKSSP